MPHMEGKIFPLRLPQNFHGSPKVKEKSSYSETRELQNNPQRTKISNWQMKRRDQDILREQQEYLVHPAKISKDMPDWLKSTSHWFHRQIAPVLKRETKIEQRQYDVLNQRKTDPFAYSRILGYDSVRRGQTGAVREVTSKVGSEYYSRQGWSLCKSDISPKIGALDSRDYTVRKPTLKIGRENTSNHIDTYAV